MDNLAWVGSLVGAVLSFFGAMWGTSRRAAYAAEKGKNLATKEDIRELTTITKRIEAEISDAVWNRQKRWEMKKEVLLEATKRLAEVDDALRSLNATAVHIKQDQNLQPEVELGWEKMVAERHDTWMQATENFRKANELVAIVCGNETHVALEKFNMIAYAIAQGILAHGDAKIYREKGEELIMRLRAARAAVRKELGIDDGQQEIANAGGV